MPTYTNAMRACINELMMKGHREHDATTIAETLLQIHGQPIYDFTPRLLGDGTCVCCRDHFPEENNTMSRYTPPNGYTIALRASAEHREPQTREAFEAEYKRQRLAEFEEEYRRLAASDDAVEVRHLSADELAKYRAPDGYAIAIAAMKAGQR